jgi:hypothetical protein
MDIQAITVFVEQLPAVLAEKRGTYSFSFVVAERKSFLARKKLTYSAQFRIDDERKELRFTEKLTESGAGMSSGDTDLGPGFGVKRETYKTTLRSRDGTIEEESKLFQAKYSYTFDFARVHGFFAAEAAKAGYAFVSVPTARGLDSGR